MSASPHLDLYVFVDALGWRIAERYGFLRDLLTYRQPLQTIFGYSSSCDPTILTGALPQEHGHFSFFYYNPEESPFRLCRYLQVLPEFLARRGRVRRLLSRVLRRYYRITGYFQIYNVPFRYLPLFDYSEKRDIYQPGGINNGQPTIFDHLRERGIPFHHSDWHAPEARRLAALTAAVQQADIRFAYLFLGDLDATLHHHGVFSPAGEARLRSYERQLRELIALARNHYPEVRVSLFSDHGMTDTLDTCDLSGRIEALGLRFGEHYVAMYDSTMARFWSLDDRARQAIPTALQQETRGHLLSSGELAHYGCAFPGAKYGELFFLMNPGILLCPSFMGARPLAGMHGYAPEHPDSVATFLSDRPPHPAPQRLDDLYELMKSSAIDH